MQLLVSKALAAGFAASMAIGGNTTLQMPNAAISPAAIYHQSSTAITFSTTSAEKRDALDSWLKKLAYLESEDKNNAKVLDSNGLYSFGCLQFQMGTFRGFGFKYGLISGDDDLYSVIYDCSLQKQIAKKMIQENPFNWRHWYTSVKIRGLGLPPKEKEEPILLSLNIT